MITLSICFVKWGANSWAWLGFSCCGAEFLASSRFRLRFERTIVGSGKLFLTDSSLNGRIPLEQELVRHACMLINDLERVYDDLKIFFAQPWVTFNAY